MTLDLVKYAGLSVTIGGLILALGKAYQRVVSWASNLKDNHLSTIEHNTTKLLDRTDEQTKVLIEIRTILQERRD